MTHPTFKVEAETDYARRVRKSMEHASLNATELIEKVRDLIPESAGIRRETLKPQTIQFLTQKAKKSGLTPYIAKACGVDSDWLRDESGPAPGLSASEPSAPYVGTGLFNDRKRSQIGVRLMSEIERCGQTAADVAARLKLSTPEFIERAKHGDFTLEDLAEIVLFLENGASLDYIVLSRFPTADPHGPIADVLEGVKKRTGAGSYLGSLERHGVVAGAPERRTYKPVKKK